MKKLVIANWKSNKNLSEAQSWFDEFAIVEPAQDEVEVVVAPPFPFLPLAKEHLPSSIRIASQDVSSFPSGQYTGAVSVSNLSGLVDFVLVGHSERRKYFKETHQDIALKVEQIISAGFQPVVCVDSSYITDQANAIEPQLLDQCIVAFEPLNAIGTGQSMPVSEVVEAVAEVKKAFGEVGVIYGGSVSWQNVAEYLLVSDGVLVGSASLQVSEFVKLINKASGQFLD